MMGSRQVTTFVQEGEEYDVLVQAGRAGRAEPADLASIRVRARNRDLVPLSNLVTLSELAEAGSLNRFNRLSAITISAGLASGHSLGEAQDSLEGVARTDLPAYPKIARTDASRLSQRAAHAVLLPSTLAP